MTHHDSLVPSVGLPVIVDWRRVSYGPGSSVKTGYVSQSYRGGVSVRSDHRSPSHSGPTIVAYVQPGGWTPALLREAEAVCLTEHRHASELACGLSTWTGSDAGLVRLTKRAREIRGRAWAFGVLARQLSDGRPMLQKHVDSLIAGSPLTAEL